jgi:Domain of unknown function (DUF4372)
MNSGKTLFAQVMEFVPWSSFARIVARYSGDMRVSALPSTEHFRIMAYAQLTWRESLRDIESHWGRMPPSCTRWGCAKRYAAPLWPMPTSGVTGASGLTWLLC